MFFGDAAKSLGDYAWRGENGGGQTRPGGEKRHIPWEGYDVYGNAW
jgi:hypothetical protein